MTSLKNLERDVMKMARLPLCDRDHEIALANLLEELCKDVYSDSEIKQFAYQVTELYNIKDGYLRVPYGVVSGNVAVLNNKYDKSHVDQIPDNLNRIIVVLRELINQEKEGSPNQKRYFQAYRSVIDLKDYVSMETIRVDQTDRQFRKVEKQTETVLGEARNLNTEALQLRSDTTKLGEEIGQVNTSAKQTLSEAQKISEEAKNLKTDVVAILAIFAAIILTFTGGVTVLGEAIATAATDAPLYRVLLVSILCILGLFNTIYLLFHMVSRLSGKNLSIDCDKGDCKECAEKEMCKGFKRFKRHSPYVVGFNIFLIVMCGLIVVTHIVLRLFGVVG